MALDLGELVAFLNLDTGKYDSAVDRMPSKLTGATAAFGAAGLVLGGVIAGALSKGLTDAISFEDSLAKISGSLALTEAESAKVGAAAGRVYAQNYGESVEQVQSVVGGVITQIQGMGDASDSTVDRMTANVLNYADAFGFETADAISMVQQLMTSGLAGSAEEAMDLMTASMQRVPESLRGDMADAITEYSPLLADLGFNGVEAFDLLVQGADRGSYGIDKAGDSIKEFGIRATDMSASSKTAYDTLGMSQEDMTNKLLAGGDTAKDAFTTIVNGLRNIEDPAAQSQAALALFGTPLEDLGTSNIPTFLDSLGNLGTGMQDTAGAAEAMGEKMGSSVASQMEAMSRQVEIMLAGLMEGLLPVLSEVFGFLAANPAVIQAVAIALGVLAVAFIGLSIATWAANAAFLASPITWIIIGILAIVGALIWLIANWDMVVAWITEVWSGFMAWIGDVLAGFATWWQEMWAGFGAWIQEVWDGFTSWITDVFTGFVSWLMGIGAAVAAWWNALWAGIGKWIQDTWQGFTSWVRGLFDGWVSWLRGVGASIASWWNGLWAGVGAFFQNTWNGFISWVTGVFSAWVAWLTGIVNGVNSWWNDLWSNVGSFFRSIWQGVTSWATALIGAFVAGWRAIWGQLTGFFSGLWSGINSGVRSIWQGILDFFGGIPGTIMGFFSGAGQWLWNAGKNIVQGLLNGIRSLAGTIGDFMLSVVPDWIKGPFMAAMGINSPSRVFAGYGENTVEGYLIGLDRMKPMLDRRMGELVDTPAIEANIGAASSYTVRTGSDDVAAPAVGYSPTIIYNAAENRSLSTEEDLFALMGRARADLGPRVPVGSGG